METITVLIKDKICGCSVDGATGVQLVLPPVDTVFLIQAANVMDASASKNQIFLIKIFIFGY